tara:strand:- start:32 stop:415 length:384 start_codon:yes stop_codon:yes gene_type:complete
MSTLTISNLNDGTTTVATTYITNGSAKAWVNFNGTGTVAIRDSFNASSLTDNAVGDYTISFVNNMANATYAAGGLGSVGNANSGWGDLIIRDNNAAPTASALRLGHIGYTNWSDGTYCLPIVQGDLA